MAPYQVGFFMRADPAKSIFWIDRVVDTIFIFDLFLSFVRPFENKVHASAVAVTLRWPGIGGGVRAS